MLTFGYRKRLLLAALFVVWTFAACLLVPGAGVVSAQDYPAKPIRIVTAGIGGGNDVGARIIAQGISSRLGQQIIVDNRAGGFTMGQAVLSAPADGHTLLYYSEAFWIGTMLQKGAGYDVEKDFIPIALTAKAPNILVVNPKLPIKSVKELIEYAKAHPGELNVSSGSAGTSSHIGGALFASMAGVNIVGIRYKSAGQEMTDLIGGHVQLSFRAAGASMPYVNSGQLRALAVTSAQPSALVPGLPTVASTVPGFENETIYGMWAPAKTPDAIIRRLNKEIVQYVKTPQAKELFLKNGTETIGSTQEEFAAYIKTDIAKITRLIKEVGIKAD
jgi:tripartite-type tricarboxylate transporter receptor subunit TctC